MDIDVDVAINEEKFNKLKNEYYSELALNFQIWELGQSIANMQLIFHPIIDEIIWNDMDMNVVVDMDVSQ